MDYDVVMPWAGGGLGGEWDSKKKKKKCFWSTEPLLLFIGQTQ